jgi:hypothetical protein
MRAPFWGTMFRKGINVVLPMRCKTSGGKSSMRVPPSSRNLMKLL